LHRNQKTDIVFSDFFLEDLAIDEVIWKNTVELDRPQMKLYYITWALRAG
jgi:hypothetical protein